MIFRMRRSTECSWEGHPVSGLLHDIARVVVFFDIIEISILP